MQNRNFPLFKKCFTSIFVEFNKSFFFLSAVVVHRSFLLLKFYNNIHSISSGLNSIFMCIACLFVCIIYVVVWTAGYFLRLPFFCFSSKNSYLLLSFALHVKNDKKYIFRRNKMKAATIIWTMYTDQNVKIFAMDWL